MERGPQFVHHVSCVWERVYINSRANTHTHTNTHKHTQTQMYFDRFSGINDGGYFGTLVFLFPSNVGIRYILSAT